MVETKTKEIGGFQVAVSQIPGRKALTVLNRLGKVAGPAITKASAAVKDGKSLENVEISQLGEAFQALFAELSDENLDFFVNNLLASATLNGKSFLDTCNLVLAGQVEVILQALWFALEVNFSNFFSGARSLTANLAPQKDTISTPV